MRQWTLLAAALTLGLMASACGAVNPQLFLTKYGNADPALEKQIRDDFATMSADTKAVDAEEVAVLVETFPEGLLLDEGSLKVKEGYAHLVIARFTLTPDRGLFVDYKEAWRKGVCYPQDVLVLATIGLWALLPPNYICWAQGAPDKTEWIEEVRRVASAAGGDLAVISFFAFVEQDRAPGVQGYIIKTDPKVNRDADPQQLPPRDSL